MIEQLTENVFRVHKTDLRLNGNEVFDELNKYLNGLSYSCLIVRKRNDGNINGSIALIENLECDYRKYSLLIVYRNKSYIIYTNHKAFEVLVDRYGYVIGVIEVGTMQELMTSPRQMKVLLGEFEKQHNVSVDRHTYKVTSNERGATTAHI